MCRITGAKVNESPSGFDRMEGRKLGARPRPTVTAPMLPDRPTLASREKKVSLVKRPWMPLSTLMKEVSAKLALSPPPRSSVPLKPNHEVDIPPLPTAALRPASPAFFMEPTYTSVSPISWTELWAWAPVAHSRVPPSERDRAIRFFFMEFPGSEVPDARRWRGGLRPGCTVVQGRASPGSPQFPCPCATTACACRAGGWSRSRSARSILVFLRKPLQDAACDVVWL